MENKPRLDSCTCNGYANYKIIPRFLQKQKRIYQNRRRRNYRVSKKKKNLNSVRNSQTLILLGIWSYNHPKGCYKLLDMFHVQNIYLPSNSRMFKTNLYRYKIVTCAFLLESMPESILEFLGIFHIKIVGTGEKKTNIF